MSMWEMWDMSFYFWCWRYESRPHSSRQVLCLWATALGLFLAHCKPVIGRSELLSSLGLCLSFEDSVLPASSVLFSAVGSRGLARCSPWDSCNFSPVCNSDIVSPSPGFPILCKPEMTCQEEYLWVGVLKPKWGL